MRNNKLYLIVTIAILGAFLLGYFVPRSKENPDGGKKRIRFENGKILKAEISDSPQKTRDGLMFRTELPKDEGMLFVFSSESRRSFWMKNTLIPLDMIWINSNKEIVDIEKSAPPCKVASCPSYGTEKPTRYVIETNGGWTEKNGITKGMKVSFD